MNHRNHSIDGAKLLAGALLLVWIAGNAAAQTLPSEDLVAGLRQGGHVIVMRHARSPRAVPDAATANPDNTPPERQLDQVGRETAAAMGKALRDLKIPLGQVLTSPAYRARETAKVAEFPDPKVAEQLGDGGQNMQQAGDAATEWLKKQAAQFTAGTNTLMITHMPNLTRAFPRDSTGVADGEALIFASDGNGGAKLVARVKIEQWPALAARE